MKIIYISFIIDISFYVNNFFPTCTYTWYMKVRKGTGLPELEMQIIVNHNLDIGHQGWVSTRAVSTLNPGSLYPHKECFISSLLIGWTSFPLLHLSLQMFSIMSHRKSIDITYISIYSGPFLTYQDWHLSELLLIHLAHQRCKLYVSLLHKKRKEGNF